MIAFPSRHRLARTKSVRLKELAQEPFILIPPAERLSLYHEVVVACRSSGFDPIVGQIVPQISSALSLVAAELGIAPVPASNAKIRVPGITFRPIEGPAPIARLALATRRESGQIVLRNFVKALKDVTAESNL